MNTLSSSVSYATAATSSNVGPQKATPVMGACSHVVDSRLVNCIDERQLNDENKK